MFGDRQGKQPEKLLLAAFRLPGGNWYVARVFVPFGERFFVASLIGQTLLIYAVLVGAIAFILRRITRPLKTLTGQIERFAETRDAGGQIAPEGPDDIRLLILAHNAMEARISALLDEKDVMLGAIGHDLKTPLAALRVRIESVESDSERIRMAATIEDIARSLDDILSLARAGRARDPSEMTELSALVASVVEEYEDMGEAVTLEGAERMAMPLRATWLRRAIRNLIGNALRYGGGARVSLVRGGDSALFRIDDDGPGIPEGEMARMLEPFTRGEASRNSETGGAGLGLALARAIAEQHGGILTLRNRLDGRARLPDSRRNCACRSARPRVFPIEIGSAPARSPTRPPILYNDLGGRVGERAGAVLNGKTLTQLGNLCGDVLRQRIMQNAAIAHPLDRPRQLKLAGLADKTRDELTLELPRLFRRAKAAQQSAAGAR